MSEIHILIADDHPIFREGLKKVITRDARLQVVGEAEDGRAALEQIRALQPQVAVLDVDMPGQDGFAVLKAIQSERLSVRVIFLTMHNNETLFHSALDAGVAGYVLKDGAITEIAQAIHAVAAGRNHISAELSTWLLNRTARAAELARRKPTLADLTPAELRVLKLVAQEKTTKEIAAELFISPKTVEHHRASICDKLELHGFNALVKFAITHKSELA